MQDAGCRMQERACMGDAWDIIKTSWKAEVGHRAQDTYILTVVVLRTALPLQLDFLKSLRTEIIFVIPAGA